MIYVLFWAACPNNEVPVYAAKMWVCLNCLPGLKFWLVSHPGQQHDLVSTNPNFNVDSSKLYVMYMLHVHIKRECTKCTTL